jgi:hypothetical protein
MFVTAWKYWTGGRYKIRSFTVVKLVFHILDVPGSTLFLEASSLAVYNFWFRGWAASNVESFTTFRQPFQMPCLGRMCSGGFSFKVATAIFAETLKNFSVFDVANPESRSCTLKTSRVNLSGVYRSLHSRLLRCAQCGLSFYSPNH